MLLRLLLLFTLVPLVELVLLLVVADHTSWQFTLGLVLLTGIVGATLARWQGTRCVQRIRGEMSAGQLPGDSLLDGLMILVAGALLVTPGVLTDLVGFSLLIPLPRRWLKGWLRRGFAARLHVAGFHHPGAGRPFGGGKPWPPSDAAQGEDARPTSADAPPPGGDRIIDVRVLDRDEEQ